MPGQRLFDSETVANPSPYFADLRTTDPVHAVEGSDVFLVTRMDLVKQIVADPQTFSNHYVGFLHRGEDGVPFVLPLDPGRGDVETSGPWVLATADPPDHGRHRRVLQRHLSASAVEALVPTMRTFAEQLLTEGIHDGRVECMASCAQLLPMQVIARLLDLPDSAIPRMLEFGYASGERIGGLASRARLEQLDQIAFGEAGAFVLDAYERAASEGNRESLVGDVVAAVDRGELDETEALGMLALVVIAGGESTTSLIGTSTFLLAGDADLQQRLRDTPESIPAFVEEALRFDPPFRNHYRLVTEDTELAGVPIPRGSHVALTWPAANRDPQAFDDPDRIDIDRAKPRSHVGFGWGIHLCVGAPLARAEARVAIEMLVERTAWVELDPDAEPPEYVPSLMIRRLRNLPLRVATD